MTARTVISVIVPTAIPTTDNTDEARFLSFRFELKYREATKNVHLPRRRLPTFIISASGPDHQFFSHFLVIDICYFQKRFSPTI